MVADVPLQHRFHRFGPRRGAAGQGAGDAPGLRPHRVVRQWCRRAGGGAAVAGDVRRALRRCLAGADRAGRAPGAAGRDGGAVG
ncbi:hypothetical protein G6F68_018710 [Rhizopus microsporus]|nr:hypothetical protein G6F68_018710 [Rhizopus microsporus]